jgi:hypothetical protein
MGRTIWRESKIPDSIRDVLARDLLWWGLWPFCIYISAKITLLLGFALLNYSKPLPSPTSNYLLVNTSIQPTTVRVLKNRSPL